MISTFFLVFFITHAIYITCTTVFDLWEMKKEYRHLNINSKENVNIISMFSFIVEIGYDENLSLQNIRQ